MEQLRAILAKLRHFFAGSLAERDFDEEARTHMALLAERFTRQGMTPEAAWREARRQFGNATSLKEARHDMQTFAWLERLWHDLLHGARLLRMNPVFSCVAIVSLGLGIGANTALFQLVVRWGWVSAPTPPFFSCSTPCGCARCRFGIRMSWRRLRSWGAIKGWA